MDDMHSVEQLRKTLQIAQIHRKFLICVVLGILLVGLPLSISLIFQKLTGHKPPDDLAGPLILGWLVLYWILLIYYLVIVGRLNVLLGTPAGERIAFAVVVILFGPISLLIASASASRTIKD